MEVILKGEPKEIAAFVVAIQEQQISKEKIAESAIRLLNERFPSKSRKLVRTHVKII